MCEVGTVMFTKATENVKGYDHILGKFFKGKRERGIGKGDEKERK